MEKVKKAEVWEEAQLEVVVMIGNIQGKINMADAKREDGNKFVKRYLEKNDYLINQRRKEESQTW